MSFYLPSKQAVCLGFLSFSASVVFSLNAEQPMPGQGDLPGAVPVSGKATTSAASSDQATPPSQVKVQEEKVRLGIGVSKPVSSVYAQLPKLPRGSGFILQSVTVGGTADVAGLKPMDVIWKLGDQLLINENQLMTLLSMHRPGDRVIISYFHAGLEKTADLVLQGGKSPLQNPDNIAMNQPFPGAPIGVNAPALPMRVISYLDGEASISDSNGTATLKFREGKPWLHVETQQGVETFNGPVTDAKDIAMVPTAWRGRLPILQRSLTESIRLRKLPRVRRVPTPKQRIAGGE